MRCPALSATRVNTWLQCGFKYKCMYHSDLPRKDSIFFKLGKAVHTALEFAGKMYEYRPFSKDEVQVIVDQFLQEAAKERIDDIELLKEGKEMVQNKISNFKFGRKTISLERFFRVKTEDGLPLIGAMDMVVEIDDETAVIDYGGVRKKINISLLDCRVDDYVLVHAGFAIQKVDKMSAKDSLQIINGVINENSG